MNGGVSDTSYPSDKSEAVSQWGAAIFEYASKIVPPSASQEPARRAFESVLSTYTLEAENGLEVLSMAFISHASVLAGGMAGFIGIPPTGSPNFDAVKRIGLAEGSSQECAELMASIIDSWYRKGKAQPITTGPTIPWS